MQPFPFNLTIKERESLVHASRLTMVRATNPGDGNCTDLVLPNGIYSIRTIRTTTCPP